MSGPSVVVDRPVSRVVAVVVCVLVTAGVPLTFSGDGPTAVDRVVGEWVDGALGGHPGVYRVLVIPSNAYVLLPLLVGGVVWFAWRREWWRAGFLLVAPELAVAVNTWVLKPLWHRHLEDYLAYPSGHTVHFVAVATAFVLIADEYRTRMAEAVAAAVLLACVAVGMVGLGYHYPTDILGGTAAAIALVTASYSVALRLSRDRRSVPAR